jgi:putative DNA methylase
MIDYTDASDLFFVWLKRALITTAPWFAFTSHPNGVQEKDQEAIVKGGGNVDHRTPAHYDETIARAFAEARRVVADDGVVTIVFGHGDPEVWHRLLGAITRAGLVLTGSWPAKTEAGGSAGSANIVTTLTMSCTPAPPGRLVGRANLVEAEVRKEVKARIPMWDAAGLAPTDQLMASAGPAMEAVGRYEQVLNHLGDPVDPAHYLVVARRAVEEAAAVVIDHLPLETFDVRTRFALSWARLYRRSVAPKSEARWQALAADLSSDELKGVLQEADKGVRLGYAKDWKGTPTETSATIDVAMAMAKAWPEGLDAVAEVLVATGRDTADNYLWAAIGYLSSLLPEADPDAVAWTSLVRGRSGIGAVTRGVVSARREAAHLREAEDRQGTLFETDWPGGVSETQREPAQTKHTTLWRRSPREHAGHSLVGGTQAPRRDRALVWLYRRRADVAVPGSPRERHGPSRVCGRDLLRRDYSPQPAVHRPHGQGCGPARRGRELLPGAGAVAIGPGDGRREVARPHRTVAPCRPPGRSGDDRHGP